VDPASGCAEISGSKKILSEQLCSGGRAGELGGYARQTMEAAQDG
jgi:hypothetical protein